MDGYFKIAPAVFAVSSHYQIMMPCEKPALFFVEVAGKCYYDESNGIMCSKKAIHRVQVPSKELEGAGEYTVCIRPIIERKPYFTETQELLKKSYKFIPVPENNIRAYHISDAHNLVSEPVRAAEAFGDIDFLILNGDVIEHSGDPSRFMNIYEICAALTKGEKPVVFSRGNHDLRGEFAEKFADYTPNCSGNTYYSFRLGNIWGVLLDCGEDKPDDHAEYGYTVACHVFRERQTEFLKGLIQSSKNEYEAKGVKHRLVVSHSPFTHRQEPPFDIEGEIYAQWISLLKESVKPDVMVCGHTHELNAYLADDTKWHTNASVCPVVVGGDLEKGDEVWFAGCGYIFKDNEISVIFTDSNGRVIKEASI